KPANKSTNFNADKIIISFDEFIELSNQSREVTITPALPQNPEIYLTKKNVVIHTGKAKLQPNTTYVIQFGQSIKDINEGNILRDYRYVFSTGPFIDSLFVAGSVIEANTGKAPENVRINLYKADAPDSAIYKLRPDYFTTAGSNGNFRIDNLAKGNYKLYALTDGNQNYMLDGDEKVGFYHSVITIDTSLNLRQPILLFPSKTGTLTLKSAYTDNRKNAFTFSQPIDSLSINDQPIDFYAGNIFVNDKKDSIILYNVPAQRFTGKSLRIVAKNNSAKLDTTLEIKQLRQDSTKFLFNFMGEINAANKYGSVLVLQANYPVKTINVKNITLLEDSVKVSLKGIRFVDSSRTQIAFDYPFDEEKKYQLMMKNGALISYFNQQSDSIKHNIQLPLRKDFGLLEARIGLPADNVIYLAQLVTSSGPIVYSENIALTKHVSMPYIAPGVYKLRLVKDENKNGRWDTGNVLEKKLPEEIIYYPEDLNIKANWEMVDVVFDISRR
ncbi:MAG: Ig-like domain-containing domain, partial [Bacteroidia bacterium]